MERTITAFRLDDEGHWVADLVCGHGQHTRHDPPFRVREWVTTEQGRAGRVGTPLDCVRCDRLEIPDGHAPYRSTPEFDETSVPKGLLRSHETRRGVWGQIHVSSGELEYTIHWPNGESSGEVLEPGRLGIVAPEVPHEVRPLGAVSFRVEFWSARAQDTA